MPNFEKQVQVYHYDFRRYISKPRWMSYWHQIDEILSINPKNILEIGVGSGVLGVLLKNFGIDHRSVDIDLSLNPDYVASVTNLPFQDNSFDVVGCFQVLEHIQYEYFLTALQEIARVSRNYIIISLPDSRKAWQYVIEIPKLGILRFLVSLPQIKPKEHRFNGEHYWEINKHGYSLERVLVDINKANLLVEKNYRVQECPYHRFFILKKEI